MHLRSLEKVFKKNNHFLSANSAFFLFFIFIYSTPNGALQLELYLGGHFGTKKINEILLVGKHKMKTRSL